jgi:hypothetical protein
MLLHTFQRCSKRLVPKLEFVLVVVDPVVGARTEKRVLALEMRMLPEAQRAPPLRFQGR